MSTFDDRCESGEDIQKDVADETFAGDALKPTHEQENVGTKNGQLDLDVVKEIADIQDNVEVEVEELTYL